MSTPLFSAAFIIIRVDETGQPVRIIPYHTNLATFVAKFITITLRMILIVQVKAAFMCIAATMPPQSLDSWRKDLSDAEVVEKFITTIWQQFPLVFIDDSWTNPDRIAGHYRRKCRDDDKSCNTRHQAIVFGGPKIKMMYIAGTRAAISKDPNSDGGKQFRVLLFTHAKSCLHELAHVFVTFLCRGKSYTPPEIGYKLKEMNISEDEAGRYLEKRMLGGVIAPLRETAQDEDLTKDQDSTDDKKPTKCKNLANSEELAEKKEHAQKGESAKGKEPARKEDHAQKEEIEAGTLYLTNDKGTFQILQKTVDEFVRFNFTLPIKPLGPRFAFSPQHD